MATINKFNTSVRYGQEVHQALWQIRNGLGKLQELDNLRADAIGFSAAKMLEVFGLYDEADAQALNDRWVNVLSAYEDSNNTEYGKLRDLLAFFTV